MKYLILVDGSIERRMYYAIVKYICISTKNSKKCNIADRLRKTFPDLILIRTQCAYCLVFKFIFQ